MVDMHIHTTGSDGTLGAVELAELCCREGVTQYSVCDHDTVSSVEESQSEAQKNGMSCVSGIELSCEYPQGDFHLLGYNIDIKNRKLLDSLLYYNEQRSRRIDGILKKLGELGYSIAYEDLHIDEGASPGKPHVARALVRKKIVASVDEAFEKLLGKDMPADVPKEKMPVELAFSLVLEAGGNPVLAHPLTLRMSNQEYSEYLNYLEKLGLKGVEAYANLHSDRHVAFFRDTAVARGLMVTGGSDFHGDKEGEKIGCYGGGRPIPDSAGNGLFF